MLQSGQVAIQHRPVTEETPMDWQLQAKQAQLRAVSVYASRPGLAQVTQHGVAELRDGLACIYEQDGHRILIDMPTAVGGSDAGPSPGYFGRAAICSCVAIGIRMAAVREDICIHAVRVKIEQDWDNRGVLAMDGSIAPPIDTRLEIDIASPEVSQKITDLVDRALLKDPWFLAFRDAQAVTTTIVTAGAL
jgi:uncharacterized OsmC-like protein